jgi:hypothetical protein
MEGHKSFVILDDVQSQLKNKNVVRVLNHLFANRRHLKLVIFVMLQNYFSMNKRLRENIDNVVLFKMSKTQNEQIFNEIIETKKDKFNEIQKIIFDKPHNWAFINIPSQRIFKMWDEIITREP